MTSTSIKWSVPYYPILFLFLITIFFIYFFSLSIHCLQYHHHHLLFLFIPDKTIFWLHIRQPHRATAFSQISTSSWLCIPTLHNQHLPHLITRLVLPLYLYNRCYKSCIDLVDGFFFSFHQYVTYYTLFYNAFFGNVYFVVS